MSGFVVALIEPLPVDQLHLPSFIVEIRGQRWSRGPGGAETFPISEEMYSARIQAHQIQPITPVPTTSIQKIVVFAGDELIDTIQRFGLSLSEPRPIGHIEHRGYFWLFYPQDARHFIESWLLVLARVALQDERNRISDVMADISPDHPWTLALRWQEAMSDEEKDLVIEQWSKSNRSTGPEPSRRLEAIRQLESAFQSLLALLRQTP